MRRCEEKRSCKHEKKVVEVSRGRTLSNGRKKDFKYVEGRMFAAEPRLKRDEEGGASSSMKNLLFAQVRA